MQSLSPYVDHAKISIPIIINIIATNLDSFNAKLLTLKKIAITENRVALIIKGISFLTIVSTDNTKRTYDIADSNKFFCRFFIIKLYYDMIEL